jgi:hypothetical protein
MKSFPSLQGFPKGRIPAPYARQMGEMIVSLLRLLEGQVPDPESHARVLELAMTQDKWHAGHKLFDVVRNRLLAAIDANDSVKCAQYSFEESCLKTMYNESNPDDPFDSVSPFFVPIEAIGLARELGIPPESVLAILVPVA